MFHDEVEQALETLAEDIRALYLLVAVLAVTALLYQGKPGDELV